VGRADGGERGRDKRDGGKRDGGSRGAVRGRREVHDRRTSGPDGWARLEWAGRKKRPEILPLYYYIRYIYIYIDIDIDWVENVTNQQHVDPWSRSPISRFVFFLYIVFSVITCCTLTPLLCMRNPLQTIGQAGDFLRRTTYISYLIRIPSYILVIPSVIYICHVI
jgi:hypothetical protein